MCRPLNLGADFLQDTPGGISMPTKVEFPVSGDGKTFRLVATATRRVTVTEATPPTPTLRLEKLE
jgi:hypothetical protein